MGAFATAGPSGPGHSRSGLSPAANPKSSYSLAWIKRPVQNRRGFPTLTFAYSRAIRESPLPSDLHDCQRLRVHARVIRFGVVEDRRRPLQRPHADE